MTTSVWFYFLTNVLLYYVHTITVLILFSLFLSLFHFNSPMKFALNPLCLENEFSHSSLSPYKTPVHTPYSSPLSSPPRIERLRLFDTPCTPRSLLRKSNITEPLVSTPAASVSHYQSGSSLLSTMPTQRSSRFSYNVTTYCHSCIQ